MKITCRFVKIIGSIINLTYNFGAFQLTLSKSSWISDIELRPDEDQIYWSETDKSQIMSARLSDGTKLGIFSNKLKNPYSISKMG